VIVIPAPTNGGAESLVSGTIEALVIDRQPLFLAALARLLEAAPLNAHVLTAQRSDVGLEIARSGEVDLIFCELRAEPISGVELVQAVGREEHHIPVVLLGDEGDDAQLAAALAANVAGLFTKNAALDEFLVGVRAVAAGHRAIGASLLGRLLERVSPFPQEARRLATQLSPTELEILAMIGQAQSIPSIAASRGISHKTVRNHLAKIYRKLELHGKTEAMLWATRMGLTSS
jgi:DNA-binding NarL/FixJ family response regulator